MKSIFRILSTVVVLVTWANYSAACEIGEQKTTSVGAKFTCASQVSAWGESWRDPSGVVWSSSQGAFRNIGTQPGIQITDSPAAKACEQIGGALPSLEDYTRFQHYFELSSNGYELSTQGISDMHEIFKDMQDSLFWTSTAYPYNIQHAYYFFGSVGYLESDWNDGARKVAHSVRCIK